MDRRNGGQSERALYPGGGWRAAGLLLGALLLGACSAPAAGGGAGATGSASAPTASAASSAAAASAAPATPVRATVRWAGISANPNNWPIYVAQSQGFFNEEAIEIDGAYTDAAPRAVQVLASRDVDLITAAADAIIEAVERGGPFVMVGGSTRIPPYGLLVRPEIRSYADLRGKLLAVTGANLVEAPFLRRLLAKYGLRDEDYETIAVGGPVQRYAAVQSGAAAGTMVPQPLDFRGADEGMNVLGYATEVLDDYQFIPYTTRTDWARDNREVVVRLLRALRKADGWLYDPANAQAAAALYAEATRENETYARRAYDLIYQQLKVGAPDASVSVSGVQAVIDLMGEQGRLAPPLPSASKYVDTSYMEAAVRAAGGR